MITVDAWIIQTKEEADQLLMRGGKIILITETIPGYFSSPRFGESCIIATALLPDFNVVDRYINGDMAGFLDKYTAMLISEPSMVYFVTILSAIVSGIPIGFVFGTEEIELLSAIEILKFIYCQFGIVIGSKLPFADQPPIDMGWMQPEFVANNVAILYMHDMLSAGEFAFTYPLGAVPPECCMQKFIGEVKPYVKDPTDMKSYYEYFGALQKGMRESSKILVDPLQMA